MDIHLRSALTINIVPLRGSYQGVLHRTEGAAAMRINYSSRFLIAAAALVLAFEAEIAVASEIEQNIAFEETSSCFPAAP